MASIFGISADEMHSGSAPQWTLDLFPSRRSVSHNGEASASAAVAARNDEIREALESQAREFCNAMEKRLDFFCNQATLRLTAISEQMARNFSDALRQETSAALNAFAADLERSRSAFKADCRNQLGRFTLEMDELSRSQMEIHKQEMLALSSTLKIRLKRVALALEAVHQPPETGQHPDDFPSA